MLDQLDDEIGPRVSIVVHDNASADGTAALIADLQARGAPITYRRHERDEDAAANIYAAVAAADADWCWLLSSDDDLVPGAIARVLALLDGHPGVAGLTVNQVVFDRQLAHVAPAQAPAAPARRQLAELHGTDAIVGELGWMFTGLSSQIVHRERWQRAQAAVVRRSAPRVRFYPQVAVALAMVIDHPVWLWCPEKLVRIRAGNVSATAGRRFEAALLREVDGLWADAVGHGAARRRLHAQVLRAWTERDGLRALKRTDAGGITDDLRLLAAFARVFAAAPRAWCRLGPVLLTPSRMLRRHLRPLRGATRPLAPGAALALAATPPQRMRRADEVVVDVELRNRSGAVVASSWPCPVFVVARWRRADSAGTPSLEGGREPLRRPVRPGRRLRLPYLLVAPWEPGVWNLVLTTTQEPGRGDGPVRDAVVATIIVTAD